MMSHDGTEKTEGKEVPQHGGAQIEKDNGASSSGKKVRDKWDYLELFLRPASSFFAAITVAIIGWYGQGVLENRADNEKELAIQAQEEETKRTETIQNYRLYTELLSKREDAESALRRDMFRTILEKFFQLGGEKSDQVDMGQRLLKLEMLALNFGESLSLSPLFIALDHDIDNFPYPQEFSKTDQSHDRDRLHSLARRVADQQLSALSTGGQVWQITVPISSLVQKGDDTRSWVWPDDDEDFEAETDDDDVITLEEISRTYRFTFSQANTTYKSVHVFLEIMTENELEPIEQEFDLNYFNFPMVDNTRLSVDQRFALILTKFGDTNLKVAAVSFPGKYSGQRDKPFLDDVIHRLQDEALQISSQDEPLASQQGEKG